MGPKEESRQRNMFSRFTREHGSQMLFSQLSLVKFGFMGSICTSLLFSKLLIFFNLLNFKIKRGYLCLLLNYSKVGLLARWYGSLHRKKKKKKKKKSTCVDTTA